MFLPIGNRTQHPGRQQDKAATVQVSSPKCTLLMIDKAGFDLVRARVKFGEVKLVKKNTVTVFGDILKEDLQRIGYIGAGGFGFVSLEKHAKTGKLYALKGVAKGHLVATNMTKGAVQEKDILMMCDSPHIINLYNTFKDTNNLYYLLELCLCGDLYALINRNKLHGKMPCVQNAQTESAPSVAMSIFPHSYNVPPD